jgi:hypothetical protein
MNKRQDIPTIPGDAVTLTPLGLLEPWLAVQANMIASMKDITDHWYARRCADIATLQHAASRLAACKNTEGLVEAQSQCASALTERFIADVSGFGQDIVAFSTSTTGAFGDLGTAAKRSDA